VFMVPKQHVQRPASMLGLPLQLADERQYSLAEILKSQLYIIYYIKSLESTFFSCIFANSSSPLSS
jgi:hypothetical protein